MTGLSGTALGDYGVQVFERDHFTCVYCGFDGRLFDNWMQLSVDHVRPKKSGGSDALDNLVTACKACNSITSRMQFRSGTTKKDILKGKQARVQERRRKFYAFWLKSVAPLYLKRPLPAPK